MVEGLGSGPDDDAPGCGVVGRGRQYLPGGHCK
jgi:hypothetical protein